MSTKPTGKDIVKEVEKLKLNIDTLLLAVANINDVDNAMSFHNKALVVQGMMADIATKSKNVQQPVPLEDGQKVLQIAEELVGPVDRIIDGLTNKRSLLDGMGLNNMKKLVEKDIKDLSAATVNMGNAMLDNGPAGVKEDGAKILKRIVAICQKGVAAFA